MGFLDTLKNRHTTASLAEAVSAIERETAGLSERIATLEASQEDAIFGGGEAALTKIQAEIAALRQTMSTLDIAQAGAERRLADARARDHADAVEKRLAPLPKMRADLDKLGQEILADLARASRNAIIHTHKQLRVFELERFAIGEGRADLVGNAVAPTSSFAELRVPPYKRTATRLEDDGATLVFVDDDGKPTERVKL